MVPWTKEQHHKDLVGTVNRVFTDSAKLSWVMTHVDAMGINESDKFELVWTDREGNQQTVIGDDWRDTLNKAIAWDVLTDVEEAMGGIDYA